MTDKMLGGLVYVTYADGAYERNFAPNAWFARVIGGAKCTLLLNRRDLAKSRRLRSSVHFAPPITLANQALGAKLRSYAPSA